ncbi:hypothetical protein FQN60_018058 [Etheostoma spectabile]|uniref:Uncharacterized protein n=1 Tax=Etheostoma spectabile TaxID=54343 RepID=A0A5J5DH66_9PERO|nr:hypothetical protein FQN60_018058 [Etheostoma spectabile]
MPPTKFAEDFLLFITRGEKDFGIKALGLEPLPRRGLGAGSVSGFHLDVQVDLEQVWVLLLDVTGIQTSSQCRSCMVDHHQYISLDCHIEGNLCSPILHLKIPGKSKRTAASAVVKRRQKHRKEQTATADTALPSYRNKKEYAQDDHYCQNANSSLVLAWCQDRQFHPFPLRLSVSLDPLRPCQLGREEPGKENTDSFEPATVCAALNTIMRKPTSVMGDLGLTLRAAAISWSWLTNSVIDRRSSGFTFNMEPGQQEQEDGHRAQRLVRRNHSGPGWPLRMSQARLGNPVPIGKETFLSSVLLQTHTGRLQVDEAATIASADFREV